MILHEKMFRYVSQISCFFLFEDFITQWGRCPLLTVIYVYELVTFCFESLETSSLGWVYFYYQSTTGLFSNEIEQWRPFTSWWCWQIYLLSTTVLEDKTGFQLWSSSSDHHGKCELTVSVVWCVSWSAAARYWHTHIFQTPLWPYMVSVLLGDRDVTLSGNKKCEGTAPVTAA